ncbi:hypothetical protein FGG08_007268 [Glutinoglossum americanum]|uniref:Uncharacterized protein n=1 Tax=Glutinoglossum americanum TaxID=1670608 RepID=A0A9P8I3Q3_9PEZI|nr:hypothetical protein FGG08_007268 [Glutinoglossum americanum]
MAQRDRPVVAVPTTAPLPHSLRLSPDDPSVVQIIRRIPRPALLAIALDWLDEKNQPLCRPYLAGDADGGGEGEDEDDDDDDEGFAPAENVEALREIYLAMQNKKGLRRELSERIIHGDWVRAPLPKLALATAHRALLLSFDANRYGLNPPETGTEPLPSSNDRPKLSVPQILPDAIATSSGLDFLGALTETRRHACPPGHSEMGCIEAVLTNASERSEELPRFHAPTFLRNLQREIAPFAKAHYYLTRIKDLPLTMLRIRLGNSPYGTPKYQGGRLVGLADDGSSVFIAFPDGTPMVYGSLSSKHLGETKSLRKVVFDAIPKAISRPREHYTLKSTSLSTCTLQALLFLRGPGRGNAAAGGWSIFVEESVECSPLEFSTFKQVSVKWGQEFYEDEDGEVRRVEEDEDGRPIKKRRTQIAKGRFGNSGIESDGRGIELLNIRMEDPFTGIPGTDSLPINLDEDSPDGTPERQKGERENAQDTSRLPIKWDSLFGSSAEDQDPSVFQTWRPDIRLAFHGTHIFAGVRNLVDLGVVDGERMPGWMTGEAGVSTGTVRNGVIRGHKGSGV